jgi:hypothetical protein
MQAVAAAEDKLQRQVVQAAAVQVVLLDQQAQRILAEAVEVPIITLELMAALVL